MFDRLQSFTFLHPQALLLPAELAAIELIHHGIRIAPVLELENTARDAVPILERPRKPICFQRKVSKIS